MTGPRTGPGGPAPVGTVTAADIRRMIEAFRASGCTGLEVSAGGFSIALHPPGTARPRPSTAARSGAGGISVLAPSPGWFRVRARPGSGVAAETVVGLLETVESEMPVLAGIAGTVGGVHLRDGAFVDYGQPLLAIIPEERAP